MKGSITVTHEAHRAETQHHNARHDNAQYDNGQHDNAHNDSFQYDNSGQDGEILIANLPLSELLSWSILEIPWHNYSLAG